MSQDKLIEWVEHPTFGNFIVAVILFNAVLLGMETSSFIMDRVGGLVLLLNQLCLSIFVIELSLKLLAYRGRFFRDGWNWFDMIIIGIALLPANEGLSVLRALRILRVLRVASATPRLRRVVEGFVAAIPGMGSVFLLMTIIFYIGAVMATKLFSASFPEWFGHLGLSAYSLFQIMTLESWSMGIVRPVMAVYPYAWMFFVPFIMITTFVVANLLVGLIVNTMQEAHSIEESESTDAYREEVLERLRQIEARLDGKGESRQREAKTGS